MRITGTQLRVGMIIEHQGELWRIMSTAHITPGNKRGHMQTKLRNLRQGTQTEYRFRSEDVVETPPELKGATVTNVLKPATTETGLVVQVPNFIAEDEIIRVDTNTGGYLSRAKGE